MIENFSISRATSQTPENGCRQAALTHTHGVTKEKSGRPGKWGLDGMMLRDEQSSKKKRQMDEGDVGVKGSSGSMNARARGGREHLRCWSYGCISVMGRRREMEDAVAVELGLRTGGGGSKKYDFFGVYDGHGGSRVAHACRERLHKLLVEIVVLEEEDVFHNNNEEEGGSRIIEWEKVMLECFQKMDDEVNRNGPAVATMGSTAVVAVVGEEEVVVANCGDSRAVLFREGVAIPLSIDHKPDRADELERIELCGGKVINWNGQRVLGVLATSRSIGDEYLKPFVIPVPQVTVSERTAMDEFLILASDGLWDVIPNDVACHVVRRCLNGHVKRRAPQKQPPAGTSSAEMRPNETASRSGGLASEAASILTELAIARGSRDNISVVVVELERHKPSSCMGGAVVVGKCSGGAVGGPASL